MVLLATLAWRGGGGDRPVHSRFFDSGFPLPVWVGQSGGTVGFGNALAPALCPESGKGERSSGLWSTARIEARGRC